MVVAMIKISSRITNLFDFILSSESELTGELALLISHQLLTLSFVNHVTCGSSFCLTVNTLYFLCIGELCWMLEFRSLGTEDANYMVSNSTRLTPYSS